MTNRTYQFYGQGFGTNPVNVTVTVNGTTAYSGPIPTVDQPFSDDWYSPDQYVVLFSIESPVEFAGAILISVSVTSGAGMKLAQTMANYVWIRNPIFTPQQYNTLQNNIRSTESLGIITSLANPPFTTEETDKLQDPTTTMFEFTPLLISHNVAPNIPGGPANFTTNFWTQADPRTDLVLNGVEIQAPNPRPPEQGGQWTWSIDSESNFTFNLNTSAGVE